MDMREVDLLEVEEATENRVVGGAGSEASRNSGAIDDIVVGEEEFYKKLEESRSSGSPFLNVEKVKDKGIKVVKVKDVIKFYLRKFPDKEKPTMRADVLVEVVNECPAKGEDFVFTLNKTTIEKLTEEFGKPLSKTLPDQLITISIEGNKDMKYLTATKYVRI